MSIDDLNKQNYRRRFALLVDGDNISATLLSSIMTELDKLGLVTIKRIYGDWTRSNMGSWRRLLHDYAARPIQQFHYTAGKNATDCALIIDAMDILYSGRVDGICLAASDSDYTRLAIRIREEGLFVLGVGRKQTPKPFVNACNLFIYDHELSSPTNSTEKLSSQSESGPSKNGHQHLPEAIKEPEKPKQLPIEAIKATNGVELDPVPILRKAIQEMTDKSGWAKLNSIGTALREIDDNFNCHRYGHGSLSKLFRAYSKQFQIKTEGKGKKQKPVAVRFIGLKTEKPAKSKQEATKSQAINNITATRPKPASETKPTTKPTELEAKTSAIKQPNSASLLKQAFGRAVQEKGWINLAVIKNCLQQIDPKFDPQQYGHDELEKLVQAHPELFEIRSNTSNDKPAKTYVRVKELTIA
ncbi:NYN domain-containing protein [Anaerolineales bacterium HSG6]|nr:NYN domain-containing protein [Anaerolineales bacterium HSG6]MDM8529635.1 NYN domain-containing protein [Anaerolineales bacterium HSG25]